MTKLFKTIFYREKRKIISLSLAGLNKTCFRLLIVKVPKHVTPHICILAFCNTNLIYTRQLDKFYFS